MFMRTGSLLALTSILFAASSAWGQEPEPRVRFDGHRLVQVTLNDHEDVRRMLEISDDHWSCSVGIGEIPFRIAPEAMPLLEASGLQFEVLIEDIQPMLDREQRRLEQRDDDYFSDFRTFAEISDYANLLVALRPDLVTRTTIGASHQSRPIFALEITGPGDASGRPGLIFVGTQHAREWLSPTTVMYITDRLIRDYGTDPRITDLLDTSVVHIIPVANPDGYVYSWTTNRMWRKNRRNNGGSFGVDLNRNWGYQWGGPGSSGWGSSEIYRGPFPFSEPETQAIRNYIQDRPELVAHIDFHTYSQLILSPWGYTQGGPPEPDGAMFLRLNDLLRGALADIHGQHYTTGPAGQTLYLASGIFPDWTYGAQGMWGWTFELRPPGPPGFTPEPDQIIPTGEENLEAVLRLGAFVTAPVVIEIFGGPPQVIDADAPHELTIRLTDMLDSYVPGTGRVYSRLGGSGTFIESSFTPAGGGDYTALIPAAPCGVEVQYYVELQTAGAGVVRAPRHAPFELYTAAVYDLIFFDDMEVDRGWTVGAPDDDATSGIWNRQNPRAMTINGLLFQPEDDHTPLGTHCWVTDGRREPFGERYDVNDGKTTLFSPVFDASGTVDPVVRYWLWYTNFAGSFPHEDIFVVEASGDGGASWTVVDVVGPTGTVPFWIPREIQLADFISAGVETQLRFVASDYGGQSRVEAAIDDIVVFDAACGTPDCPGDINGDGQRDLADLSALLAAYGTCTGDAGFNPAADLNGSGCVDLADLSGLLTVFGVPCF